MVLSWWRLDVTESIGVPKTAWTKAYLVALDSPIENKCYWRVKHRLSRCACSKYTVTYFIVIRTRCLVKKLTLFLPLYLKTVFRLVYLS